ncbi:MAG: flagellar assembly protein FliW [Holosporales bacterium]
MQLTPEQDGSTQQSWTPALDDNPQGTQILFNTGLLAFQAYRHYYLCAFPKIEFAPLMLLKCLERKELGFLLYPLDTNSEIRLTAEDIQEIGDRTGMDVSNIEIFLVVTAHQGQTATHFTVNKRAPVIVDVTTQNAVQVVLSNAEYAFETALPKLSDEIARRRRAL